MRIPFQQPSLPLLIDAQALFSESVSDIRAKDSTIDSRETLSSCPDSALVVGVKIGSVSRSHWRNPAGNGNAADEPVDW